MHHAPVKSSNISSVGYDPQTKTLEVIFNNGGHYSHADVPKDVYNAFMAADSKGRYYASKIRGQFKFSKLGAGETS